EGAPWRAAERGGAVRGAGGDEGDSFIHFSTPAHGRQTAAQHFARPMDLILVGVDADALGGGLKWEVSRGGDLFPHLYGALPLAAVRWGEPPPLDADQRHPFPELEPGSALC